MTHGFSYKENQKFSDVEFVKIQYEILFNRAPDSDGLAYYLGRLQSGHSRESIVQQMVSSPEFKKNIDSIPQLRDFLPTNNSNRTKKKSWMSRLFNKNRKFYQENAISHLQTQNKKTVGMLSLEQKESSGVKIWDRLLDISSLGNNIWFGLSAPIKTDFFDFGRQTNFRASSNLHGTYDTIWLFEANLFSYSYWKLLIDESIRLMKSKGFLIVRAQDSEQGTIWELKSILGRCPTIESELYYQERLEDGSAVIIFAISRKFMHAYIGESWTIGVLTNGTKNENVVSLIEKFEEIKGNRAIEYIVAGPNIPELSQYKIRYVDYSYADDLPRIAEKKRLIVTNARFDNIAIFHDRYQISSNFFEGFARFGYDFEFVTIAQEYEDGSYFPGYAGLRERKKRWQRPVFDQSNNSLFDGHFINGGLMILKKHIGMIVNFNGLLLHNEAEDVELTFQMMDLGIMPRFNIYCLATTVGISNQHTATFEKV